MGTTGNLSLPYPEPTDPVADGAADMRALAEAIDPLLFHAATTHIAGATTIGDLQIHVNTGGIYSTDVNGAALFGYVPFRAPGPIVLANCVSSEFGIIVSPFSTTTTTTQALCRWVDSGARAANIQLAISWIAIGLRP